MARALVFGPSSLGSFASFDRDTSSWRTSQLCLDGEWDEYSETWPRAGMTRNGTAYRLRPLAPLTDVIGSGSLLTPTAAPYNQGGSGGELAIAARLLPTPVVGDARQTRNATANRTNPNSAHHAGETLTDRLLPTPTKSDGQGGPGCSGRDGGENLWTTVASSTEGSRLNPCFVEWMMGYPTGWTDSQRSETHSCRKSPSGSAGA